MKLFPLLLLLYAFSAVADPKRIVVASEVYPGYVNDDKSGMYIDILSAIYPNTKIDVIITTYERSIRLVENKRADLWFGAYLNERSFALYPSLHMDQDKLALAYLDEYRWHDLSATEGKKVAWVTGYSMGKYLPTTFESYEIPNIDTGVKMLRARRIDFIVDDFVQLKNSQFFDNDINIHIFKRIPLYPGFVNSERGKKLVTLWDKGMQKMIDNGDLKLMFDNDPDSEYPYQ